MPFTRRLHSLLGKPYFIVGCMVLGAAALASVFSTQVVGYEPDEVGYTHLALGIAHSLSPITSSYGGHQRLNQLYPLLIAPFWGTFGNVTAFRLVHIWNTLLMASTAIPVYFLARDLVRLRWVAYFAAALVVLAPWLTLSLAEFTEVAAFPACAWALFAMQRALAEPSPKRDLVALIAIAVATYGRLQLVILGPVLVVAMLLHEFGYELVRRDGQSVNLRRVVSRVWRRHTPLAVAGILAVVIGIPLLLSGRLSAALGFYGDTLTGFAFGSGTFDLARSYLSFIFLGAGILPAILALGFFGESLIAPYSRKVHAFASLGLVAIVALSLQVAEVTARFDESVLQERYLFYILPLIVVGMCTALLTTRHPVRMAIGGTVVVAFLIGTTHYQAQRDAFWYQVSPAMTGFYDWIRPMFGGVGGPTANPGAAGMTTVGLVALALGIVAAAVASRLSPARSLAVLASVALAFCCAETANALWRVVHGNASGRGFGTGSLRNVDWVDRSVPAGSKVGQLVSNVNGLGNSRGLWEDSEFWNRTITGAYSFGGIGDSYFATSRLNVNQTTGAVNVDAGGVSSTPSYLVSAARGFPVGFAGKVSASSPKEGLQLQRVTSPLQAAWATEGVSSDGWLPVGHPATLTIFMHQFGGSDCAEVKAAFSLSPLSSSNRALSVVGRGVGRRLTIAPGETRAVEMRVCAHGTALDPRLQMASIQVPWATNPQLTLQLKYVTVTAQ